MGITSQGCGQLGMEGASDAKIDVMADRGVTMTGHQKGKPSQPLPPDALARLAEARSAAIAAALKEAGVDLARVSQPAAEKTEVRGKLVPLKLGLASR